MRSSELYKELERGDADYGFAASSFFLAEVCCLQAHLECILHGDPIVLTTHERRNLTGSTRSSSL